jgi:hypothetical protein
MTFTLPAPEQQVAFALALRAIRKGSLQEALFDTVSRLDLPTVDRELAAIVPHASLANLAAHGLRGELMFAVPSVIEANPRLIAYYRLLYGYSQKEFHQPDVGALYRAAEQGRLGTRAKERLPDFCRAMAKAGSLLLSGISTEPIGASFLDNLTLLTLGPQLRGGSNVRRGAAAIAVVFGIVKNIVVGASVVTDQRRIAFLNAAGRQVLVEFAADPDIIVREELPSGGLRRVVAIEVKGGRDFANVHNRIGEAEKSHQKARNDGYAECWTVVNVDRLDLAMARRESPSTDRFYLLSDLVSGSGPAHADFRDRLTSILGLHS